MATIRLRIAAVVGAAILAAFGLTACESTDTTSEAADSAPATTDAEEPPVAEPTPQEPAEAPDDDSNAEAPADESPTDATPYQPEGLPDGLPDIGIPFYDPSSLMAITSEGDPWVLEFVTDAALEQVNEFIATQLSEANGWQEVDEEVFDEQDQTVTTASRDGYQLVIAVAPERVDQVQTSLFYTLSTQ